MEKCTVSLFILFMFLCFHSITAQEPTLKEKLVGQNRVEDIMDIVMDHFKAENEELNHESANEDNEESAEEEEENEFLHWARWGLYMSARTDERGRMVDVDEKIREAYESYDRAHRSSEGNWIFRGPSSVTGANGDATGIGRVDRVAFHPTNPNIIYIGTPSGGLLKSIDDGGSWTPMTDNIPSISVSGIVVSWADPNDVYILTGDGDSSSGGLVVSSGYHRSSAGVFVSHDGGTNWASTGNFPVTGSYAGYNLAQSQTNANVLLAATTYGLFRTLNGGASWTLVLEGETYEVAFKPNSGSIAYATQKGEFYRSVDGGISWTEVTDFDNHYFYYARVAMAVCQSAPSTVYLFNGWAPETQVDNCGDDPSQLFGGIFISSDNGVSFTRKCETPNLVESCCDGTNSRGTPWYDLALGVSHGNFLNLISGGILAWRSTNGGQTWSNASGDECGAQSNSSGFIHPDVHDVEFNPLNNHVYLCNDGGIMKSTNNGIDWISLNSGVVVSQAYHLAGSQSDLDNMMIGLQDNGMKRRNAATTIWDHVGGGDGYDCIYAWNSASAGYYSSNSRLSKFTANGSSHQDITPDDEFFKRVTCSVTNSNLVIAGSDDIYKSTNAGNSWSNKGHSGTWDVERCPSNGLRFYAAGGSSSFATTGSMFISEDEGDSWNTISGNPGYPTGLGTRMTDIDVRPNNSFNVWITFGGFSPGNKVFFSPDAGDNWFNKTGSLPNVPVNTVEVDANNNVYIGTDIGVFYRAANATDWVPFWHRLPVIPVTDLELYEADGIIRCATFGRGVWESDTYAACALSQSLSGNLSGNRYYEVSSSLLSSNTITGGSNTKIIFKSGNYISLNTGFEAKIYNTVHAYIAPCGEAQLED